MDTVRGKNLNLTKRLKELKMELTDVEADLIRERLSRSRPPIPVWTMLTPT